MGVGFQLSPALAYAPWQARKKRWMKEVFLTVRFCNLELAWYPRKLASGGSPVGSAPGQASPGSGVLACCLAGARLPCLSPVPGSLAASSGPAGELGPFPSCGIWGLRKPTRSHLVQTSCSDVETEAGSEICLIGSATNVALGVSCADI